MRLRSRRPTAARRGVVLLLVLTMLTLFAVVAIGFVLFSEQEKKSAAHTKGGEEIKRPDPDLLFAFFMNRMLYDTEDRDSVLTGQGLLRLMYGRSGNFAFSGSGKLHFTDATVGGQDGYYFIRYSAGRHPDTTSTFANNVGAFNPPYTYPDQNSVFLGALRSDGVLLALSYRRTFLLHRRSATASISDSFTYDPYEDPTFWTAPFNNNYQPPQPPPSQPGIPLLRLTDNQRRAMVLRPIKADTTKCNSNFPDPGDIGGDVKQMFGVLGYPVGNNVYAVNDSFWMDPNFPVQVGPDGRRYKPLFAVFTMDLDSKLNVNTHFNNLGLVSDNSVGFAYTPNTTTHTSKKGLAPWEVGPPPATPGIPELASFRGGQGSQGEFHALLINRAGNGAQGRYCNQSGPTENPAVPGAPGQQIPLSLVLAGPNYSPVEFTMTDDTPDKQRTNPPAHPGMSVAKAWRTFPHYPAGYDNSGLLRTNHPLLYDPLALTTADRKIAASNLELLYRMGDTGTDGLVSDLLALCPQSFATRGLSNRLRWMVTTDSTDMASYGFYPWYYLDRASNANILAMMVPDTYPRGNVYAYPIAPTATVSGDFDNTNATRRWQSRPLSSITGFTGQRWDKLNQPFVSAYPSPDPNTGKIDPMDAMVMAQYNAAVAERRQRATEIYAVLRQVTGAYDPNTYTGLPATAPNPPAPTPGQANALRYLSQLAANLVDQMDPDDNHTSLNWGNIGSTAFRNLPALAGSTNGTMSNEWVFGTELPRLVLNEAYVDHSPADVPGIGIGLIHNHPGILDFWIELLNPHFDDAALADGGKARLVTRKPDPNNMGQDLPDYGIYQIVLTDRDGSLRLNHNVLGDPDATKILKTMVPPTVPGGSVTAGPDAILDFTDLKWNQLQNSYDYVLPVKGAYSGKDGQNQGFYVAGPSGRGMPGSANRVTSTHTSDKLRTVMAPSMISPPPDAPPPNILLRRLACPTLPPDNNKASATYNPYVTVDYMEEVRVNRRARDDSDIQNRRSEGKLQPFASGRSFRKVQQPRPPRTNEPQHTLFWHNAGDPNIPDPNWADPPGPGNVDMTTMQPFEPADYQPFDWLVHLDRPMLNPIEVGHVSGFKPQELTQQFVVVDSRGNTRKFQHLAPWGDPVSRLYRFLEFVEARPLSQWGSPLTRRAGKINLNTIYDWEIFAGMADMANFVTTSANPVAATGMPETITPENPALLRHIHGQRNNQPGTGSLLLIDGTEWVEVISTTPTTFTATFAMPRAARFTITVDYQGQLQTVWKNLLQSRDGPNSSTRAGLPGSHPFYAMSVGPQLPGGTSPSPFPNGSTGIDETWLRSSGQNVANPLWGANQSALLELRQNSGQEYEHPYDRLRLLSKLSNNLTTRSNVFAVWITVGYFEVDDQGKLGREIGSLDGRQQRHRFFAVIDRSVHDQGYLAPTTGSNIYAKYDPRKDYSSLTDTAFDAVMGAGNGRGPKAAVLYWSMIE